MGIKAKRDLYAVLAPEQREKQNALRDRIRQKHRARMFSSQGMDGADRQQTADGMTPASESTPQDAENGLQAS